MITLKSIEHKNTKRVCDMDDGEVGIITDWTVKSYIGRMVQAYGDSLVVLGEDSGKGWSSRTNLGDKCLVRLLEDGEELIYNKNEG